MKKLMIVPVFFMMLVSAVNAQTEIVLSSDIKPVKKEEKEARKALRKPEGKEVSYQAKEQFYRDFGNAPVMSSERSNGYDEFIFNKDGVITRAYYDYDAGLVGFTQMKTLADLPGKALKSIEKMYPGYIAGEVLFFDDNEYNDTDMFLYNSQFDDEDSYFVELVKDSKKIVVHVNMYGEVSYFTTIR